MLHSILREVKHVQMIEPRVLCHDVYRYPGKQQVKEQLKKKKKQGNKMGEETPRYFLKISSPSPRWTQWSIETSLSVHILPILRRLLLSHAAGIISHHFLPLCRAEAAKAHHGLHGGEPVVVIALALNLDVFVLVHPARRRGCVFPLGVTVAVAAG